MKRDFLLVFVLTLIALLARLPYLALIPAFGDETMQTVYALDIRPGEFMPLVSNDPYTGPFFVYLLAICLRLFGVNVVAPRIVVMVMGALTVGVTYLLARALGLSRPWAGLAGLLMAVNPHHILVNSHSAGATYTLPLFSTGFLLVAMIAIKRESGRWLIVAGVLLGLALQANPVLVLMLPGLGLWLIFQRRGRIGLRSRWPYLAGAAFLVAYSPVILYNLQTNWQSVHTVVAERSYLWQSNPSPPMFVPNLWRLMLQLCRQIGGVLEGDETLRSLMGLPLVLSLWAGAGLIDVARRGISLPILAVGSQMLIMPWLSDHYGMTGATRFTNQLTPLILIAMSASAERLWNRIYGYSISRMEPIRPFSRWRLALPFVAGALGVALSLWLLTSLFDYYHHAEVRGETNTSAFAFFNEFMQRWKGDLVLLSDSPARGKIAEYFLTVNDVPHWSMPLGRIMESLATGQVKGSVTLILYKEDLPLVGAQADLIDWQIRDGQTSWQAYTILDAQQVRKPSYVFASATAAPAIRMVEANLADQLQVIGYEIKPGIPEPGGRLIVNVHWQAKTLMSEVYIGFLHLNGPDGRLMAQDDHELGRGFYRTIVWQPGEVIREKYSLTLPEDMPSGDYSLRVGAYGFPSLRRLTVHSASVPTQDDMVVLGIVHVGSSSPKLDSRTN